MRLLLAGVLAASVAVTARAAPVTVAPRAAPVTVPAPAAPPAWSFDAPLGGFDLGAAQRGFGLYEQRCASCHAMAALTPADLPGLGFDPATVAGVLRGLHHRPFTAGRGAPDLSRTERVMGADAAWRLLLAPAPGNPYNGLPPGHPVLRSRDDARDLVTFLAWAAQPHLTRRRQLGVAILLFGLLLIGLGTFTTRRRSRHG